MSDLTSRLLLDRLRRDLQLLEAARATPQLCHEFKSVIHHYEGRLQPWMVPKVGTRPPSTQSALQP
jgi:hypothetical protein